MLRGLDPSTERFLIDLERISSRTERAQRQIGSGLKLAAPSDDPGHVIDLLGTRLSLLSNRQIQTNLGRVKTEVDTAEQALGSAVSMLDRALQIGAQGAGLQTQSTRATLAAEVRAIQEQLVSVAGTAVEGRYIFSGDADQTRPYTVDQTRPNAVSAYQGAPATREIVHPTGSRFSVSKTAQEIFDNPDPAKNVFAAVNALRTALENPPLNPDGSPDYDAQAAAIRNAIPAVRTAQEHLNAEVSFYGAAQNRIADATDLAGKLDMRIKSELSAIEDADITEAILELNQAKFHQDVALSSRAKMPNTSLFDYLG